MADGLPRKTGQSDIQVDLMRPEEAPQVAELFQAVYGQGYPMQTYYHPDELLAANREGRIISSVARTAEGRVVGHNALYRSAPGKKIYESGAGLVHSDFRAGNLFGKMCAHGVQVGAPKFGIEAVFGEPVCNHLFSQKMCHSLDWVSCALEVDLMPAAAYTKEKSAQGRVSAILDFAIIEPRALRVYLPQAYDQQLRELYQGLNDEREMEASQSGQPGEGVTRLDVDYFEFASVARLALWEAGADFGSRLERELAELRAKGAEVIQVWVNLTIACVDFVVDELRNQGFFFGGLLPRWFDVDGMLMQWVAAPPDWEGMNLLFPRALRLRDMACQDWSRTA